MSRSMEAVSTDSGTTSLRDAVHPEPERRRVYDELYQLYKRIYPSVREVVGGLSRLLNPG